MKPSQYISKSFKYAFCTFLYILAVSLFFFNASKIFGNEPDNFLIPLFMLLLFVISASITGLLVLGKPIHLYVSGMKKEAFNFLFATLGWLVVFALIVASVLVIY